MYDDEVDVPDEAYTIPFGEANVTREGDDATIIAFGRMVNFANEAADSLAEAGITCTVVDPRTTSPLDKETILGNGVGNRPGGGGRRGASQMQHGDRRFGADLRELFFRPEGPREGR